MNFLNVIFGNIIRFFCELCGNQYWLGIFVFTAAINLLLVPLNIKQQKSTATQARMKNKLARIKEKYGDDRQRYQEEMSKIYSESGASPLSGCLPMLIRLPIFFAIYGAIRQSLTYIYGASEKLIGDAAATLDGMGVKLSQHTQELDILRNYDALVAKNPAFEGLMNNRDFNFDFFGINLFESPDLGKVAWIWIIPLISFATSMLMSIYSTVNAKKTNPDAAGMGMGCMMFGMPIFSLVLTFGYPGAVGWYWACSNIVSTVISVIMTKMYAPGKLVAQLEAKEAKKRRAYEQRIINPQAAPAKKSIIKK